MHKPFILPKLEKSITQKIVRLPKQEKKALNLTEAKKQGYEACKICKIDQPKKIADKPKDKKTTHKTK
jgi:hypothetical protein